jgi:hypothetical protein
MTEAWPGLTPQTLRALGGPCGWTQLGALAMLRGRRDLRSRLEQAPDATDELVADPSPWPSSPVNPPDLDAVAQRLVAGGTPPRGLRILIFQRDQRAQARTRWPQIYPDPDDQYYPAAEARWRNLAETGARDMQIVPVTVAELMDFAHRTGADPTDAAVKTRYIQSVSPQAMIPWPPPRNAPCWCGSGAKYKSAAANPTDPRRCQTPTVSSSRPAHTPSLRHHDHHAAIHDRRQFMIYRAM